MGLFDRFRKPRIADWAAIDGFIDRNAAFMVNRSMYEYARARSGLLSEKLLREKPFQDAIEHGRWRAFPICVGNVAEMIEADLRPRADAAEKGPALIEALCGACRRVLSAYPEAEGVPADFWPEAQAAVEARLRLVRTHAPKAIQDIPLATFAQLFDLVPLHPDVRKLDYEVVQNHVRGIMVNAADRFRAEVDAPALVAAL